ncbi:RING-type E3 ubiquitin transferase [Ranunculus cassubicifolius]
MNTTDYSNGVLSERVNGAGYFIGISIGVIFLIATIALASYFCKQPPTIPYQSRQQPQDDPSIGIDIELDEMTLQSYPTLFYPKAKMKNKEITSCCSICLSDYKNIDVLRQLPGCGHLFHLKCVDPWLRLHPTCPVCRNTLTPTPFFTPLTEVVAPGMNS